LAHRLMRLCESPAGWCLGAVGVLALLLLPSFLAADQAYPRTLFQTGQPYRPDIDIRADAVIAYPLPWGATEIDAEKIRSWSGLGYDIWAMLSISHAGRDAPFGGTNHPEIVQRDAAENPCLIGDSAYVVPTDAWNQFVAECALACVENGASAVCLEEPEFWVRAGYSDAFKSEWHALYGSEWEDPASSAGAAFRASWLKAHLYLRSYEDVFKRINEKGPDVLRLVPVHSPLNYAQWGIIFPHAAAFRSPFVDGMIGQVWTGTARTPIRYEGVERSRVFENAYLEYSYFANLARGALKPMWFLVDPVEDDPRYTWSEYRSWFHETLTAALFFPEVSRYEVTPWPERVLGAGARDRGGRGDEVPQSYATELLTIWSALGRMAEARPEACRRVAGTEGIGVVVADTISWQRGGPAPSTMDSFYGLTLPLLTRGIPVQTVPLERAWDVRYLQDFYVLLLSYDAAKPLKDGYNEGLKRWVERGGVLVLFGGTDPYNDIDSWWREQGCVSPTQHLLKTLGFGCDLQTLAARTLEEGAAVRFEGPPAERIAVRDHAIVGRPTITAAAVTSAEVLASCDGAAVVSMQRVGDGCVIVCALPPAYFVESASTAQLLADIVRYAVMQVQAPPYVVREGRLPYTESTGITVRRGKYVAARAMNAALTLPGRYLDLLDPLLNYVTDPKLDVGEPALFYDLQRIEEQSIPRVLLTSGRIEKRYESPRETSVILTGPEGRIGVGRIYAPKQQPASAAAFDADGRPMRVEAVWDEGSRTLLFVHDLSPQECKVSVFWSGESGELPPPGLLYQALDEDGRRHLMPDTHNPQPLIVAHRGASQAAPENTLAAIRKALEMGVDLVEIDVWRTKDNHAVVIHDRTVNRTTNGNGAVHDLTLDEIHQLDAGSWKSEEYAGERVPTLSGALNAVKGRAKLLIEIKDQGIERLVADAIGQVGEEWAVVQSFDFDAAAGVKRLLPNVECGWLLGALPEGESWKRVLDRAADADLSFLACVHTLVDADLVSGTHARGLCVYAWTVDDPDRIRQLADIGVDGVITNAPDHALDQLR
jgi:glycerophosphoryl diester phosphodiesterase